MPKADFKLNFADDSTTRPTAIVKDSGQLFARSIVKKTTLPGHIRKDWTEYHKEVSAKMETHLLRCISELIPLALEEAPLKKLGKGKAK